ASSKEVIDEKNVFGVDYHRDGRRVALAHDDGTITLHDLTGAAKPERFAAGPAAPQITIALHPSQELIAVCSYFSRTVQVRDLNTGRLVAGLTRAVGSGTCAWALDGRTLAVSGWNSGDIWLYAFDPEAPAQVALRLRQTLVSGSGGTR